MAWSCLLVENAFVARYHVIPVRTGVQEQGERPGSPPQPAPAYRRQDGNDGRKNEVFQQIAAR